MGFENGKRGRNNNEFGQKGDGPRKARMPEGERYRKPAKETPKQRDETKVYQEYIPPELSEEELAEALAARDATPPENPEVTKQETEPTYQSFEEAGFKPSPLSDAGRKWIFGIPMKEVHNTRAIPIDIQNAFAEAGFTAEIDNGGTNKIIRISAPGADGALFETALTHREAVEYLKNIARDQNLADAEAVSNGKIPDDTNKEDTLIPTPADEPNREETPVSADEEAMPDVDTTRTRNPFLVKSRVEAAEAELNGYGESSAPEDLVAKNENVHAEEPAIDTVSPSGEVDAVTQLNAGWRRVKDVSEINKVKAIANERREEKATKIEDKNAAKLRIMRERIQAAYARQKQNAVAEKMTENKDVPAEGVPGVDIELPGMNVTPDIDLTELAPVSEVAKPETKKPLTVEEALEEARIKVRKDLEDAMGGKPRLNKEGSLEVVLPIEDNPASPEADVVRQQLDIELARGTKAVPKPAPAAEAAPAQVDPKNSAEELLKELQKAYENETYNTPEFARLFPEFAANLKAAGGDRKAAMGLLLTKYEKLNQKVVEQRKKERLEKVATIAERFKTEFNISLEQLASIEGIETLSKAQQKLLFENFTQLTLGSVREEAAALTANLTAEQRKAAVGTYGKVLGNAMAGLRETFTKTKNALANEKAVAKQVREGGFAVHQELLTQLVEGMVANGPAVTEENGELVIDLVNLSPAERGTEDSMVARSAALLSQEANAFARIPATARSTVGVDEMSGKPTFGARIGRWFSTDKKERANQERYQEAATAYESAKAGLTEALREQGMSDIEIAKRILAVDTKVSQQQMLMTDPNAIEALAEIEDKSFWKETAKNFAKGNGFYFGLGFVGRTALGATGGVFAMPLVAAGVASLRSWNASAATLRERDRNQRAGMKDADPGALNVVSAERLIEKTERLLERAHNPAATDEERQQTLNSLRVRVEYIQDKMLLGRVSYGAKAEAVRTQTELAKLLGEAMTVLAAEEQNFRAAMADRYERLTGKLDSQQASAEERIIEERSAYRSDHLTNSAYKASLFSLAGMTLGAIADEAGTGNKMAEYLKDAKTRVGAWWEGTPLGGIESDLDKLKELEAGGGGGKGVELPSSAEVTSSYTIERGDTLTKILKEQVLGDNEKPTGGQLARFFNSLSTEELQSIGVRSNDADLIFAGEAIDTEKLQELWEAKQSVIGLEVTPETEAVTASNENDVRAETTMAETRSEAPRAAPEVTADIITKLRARDIGKHILEEYAVEPTEWETLRTLKVGEVLNVAEKYDSWFDILGGKPIPKVGVDIHNLETVIKQAAEPGVNIKPYKTETLEMFMLRLSTKLAEIHDPDRLPASLRDVVKSFNLKVGVEKI